MSLEFLKPQLATAVDHPPPRAGWIHEVKHDGYRTLLIIEHHKTRAYTRNGYDAYPGVVVRDGDRRVIECRDGIQFILQRRRQGGRWIDLGYFRNRDALIARCGMTATAIEVLRALPPYHLGRNQGPLGRAKGPIECEFPKTHCGRATKPSKGDYR
jgi:hypothetical protein